MPALMTTDASRSTRVHKVPAIADKLAWMRPVAGESFDEVQLHMLLQPLAITDNRAPVLADLAGR